MPRFFTEPITDGQAVLTGEAARHIVKSLRMREGDALTLCDGAGTDYICKVISLANNSVAVQVVETAPNQTEPAVRVRLYQALPKGDKLDLIVQKAVELGVSEIVPVLTERCVSRPDGAAMQKKAARMQKIAQGAAEQSGRGRIPQIRPLMRFQEAVDDMHAAIAGMNGASLAILLYERANEPLSIHLQGNPAEIALLSGSEGGFSPEEAAYAAARGVSAVSLGKRILRCETAPLCALSAILFACGEF